MSQARKVRATQSFSGGTPEADRMVTGGAILDADDPIVKAFPGFFEALVEVIPEPLPTPAKKAAPPRKTTAKKQAADD